MRVVVAVLAISFAASGSGGAKADPYAWCAEYSGGGLGGSSNCYFVTLDQCKATIAGVGGTCSPNPWYTGPAVNQQPQQQQQQSPGWSQPQQQRPWWMPQQQGYYASRCLSLATGGHRVLRSKGRLLTHCGHRRLAMPYCVVD